MRKVNIKVRQKSSCSYEASVYIDGKRLYRSARTEKEAKSRIKQAIQDAEKGKTIFRTGNCVKLWSIIWKMLSISKLRQLHMTGQKVRLSIT